MALLKSIKTSTVKVDKLVTPRSKDKESPASGLNRIHAAIFKKTNSLIDKGPSSTKRSDP